MADEQQAGSGEISDEQSQGASADGQQDASADGQRDQGRRASGVSAEEQGADGQRRRQGRRASVVSADGQRADGQQSGEGRDERALRVQRRAERAADERRGGQRVPPIQRYPAGHFR